MMKYLNLKILGGKLHLMEEDYTLLDKSYMEIRMKLKGIGG